MLRDRRRREKKKQAEVKWVNWLGIILGESLTFERPGAPRLWKQDALVIPSGKSVSCWRGNYILDTGMIKSLAMWGAGLGWRRQGDWDREFGACSISLGIARGRRGWSF